MYFPKAVSDESFRKAKNCSTSTWVKYDIFQLLHDQLVQTGSQEILLAKSQSVNSIQPGKFPTSTGCPALMFAESVYSINTTNKLDIVVLGRRFREIIEFQPKNQLFLKIEKEV